MEVFLHQPLNAGEWVGILFLVGIVGFTIISVTSIITSHYRKVQLDEMESSLKMEMIQRGMSSHEIKEVLRASTESCGDAGAKLVEALAAAATRHRAGHQADAYCNR